MAVLYRCDVCGKETASFWSLTFKRSKIVGSAVVEDRVKSLDVCGAECEQQAASELLRRLSPHASVDAPRTHAWRGRRGRVPDEAAPYDEAPPRPEPDVPYDPVYGGSAGVDPLPPPPAGSTVRPHNFPYGAPPPTAGGPGPAPPPASPPPHDFPYGVPRGR